MPEQLRGATAATAAAATTATAPVSLQLLRCPCSRHGAFGLGERGCAGGQPGRQLLQRMPQQRHVSRVRRVPRNLLSQGRESLHILKHGANNVSAHRVAAAGATPSASATAVSLWRLQCPGSRHGAYRHGLILRCAGGQPSRQLLQCMPQQRRVPRVRRVQRRVLPQGRESLQLHQPGANNVPTRRRVAAAAARVAHTGTAAFATAATAAVATTAVSLQLLRCPCSRHGAFGLGERGCAGGQPGRQLLQRMPQQRHVSRVRRVPRNLLSQGRESLHILKHGANHVSAHRVTAAGATAGATQSTVAAAGAAATAGVAACSACVCHFRHASHAHRSGGQSGWCCYQLVRCAHELLCGVRGGGAVRRLRRISRMVLSDVRRPHHHQWPNEPHDIHAFHATEASRGAAARTATIPPASSSRGAGCGAPVGSAAFDATATATTDATAISAAAAAACGAAPSASTASNATAEATAALRAASVAAAALRAASVAAATLRAASVAATAPHSRLS